MFLLRKRKMILNFGKMLDIMPKFDIITVAFQRQQVGEPPVNPAEDGKIILMMLFCPHVFRHEDSSFLNASDPGGRRSAANSHGGETKYA